MRGQHYLIEFAFFGDRDRLKQPRAAMLAADYNEDTSQSDQSFRLTSNTSAPPNQRCSPSAQCTASRSTVGVSMFIRHSPQPPSAPTQHTSAEKPQPPRHSNTLTDFPAIDEGHVGECQVHAHCR